MSRVALELEEKLCALIASCAKDPLRFVRVAFPWGEGELEGLTGPYEWQTKILGDIRDGLLTVDQAIRIAVASGHGIGKSALVAWIVYWAVSTKVDTKGIVTANTETQLKTKTWAELAKWHRLAINSHWFDLTATALISRDPAHTLEWRVDQIAWSEARSEAFAGLHNKGKRVLLIFDEASAIPDVIWEVAEGALTDEGTEILQICFGNPTRSSGRFRDCFGRFKQRWKTYQIDSRDVPGTNKAQIQAWIEDYGLDSDFVKVRVRGVFPSADVNALFSRAEVEAAMVPRYTVADIQGRPKVVGVDVARQGDDDSVIAQRQGLAVYPLKVLHVPDNTLVASAIGIAVDNWQGADGVFVDATGGYGAGVVDAFRNMNRTCIEVYFSGKADDLRYFNKRSEMFFLLSKWVKSGGQLPFDEMLLDEMCAITYTFTGDKFRICSKDDIKEEIGRSPDRADAVALTFAFPVVPSKNPTNNVGHSERKPKTLDYDPLSTGV